MAVTQTEHATLSKHGYRRKSDREYVRDGGHSVSLSGFGDWSHSGGQHSAGGKKGNSGRGVESLDQHLSAVHSSQHSEEEVEAGHVTPERAEEVLAANPALLYGGPKPAPGIISEGHARVAETATVHAPVQFREEPKESK